MKVLRTALIAGLIMGASWSANAHPVPKTATPAPDAVLAASPTEIRIGFSESLVIAFTGWPVPGFDDTELGVFMEPEVDYGTTEVYAGVQA